MFASLSSFLPSALQQVSQAARPPTVLSPPPTEPPDTEAPAVDPPRKQERKEKKEKHANEAFIIVRPPPSKSAHPLSLQVQLVPPQSRNDRPVQALDTSPDDFDTDLKRTHSNRSETSNYSGYTSVGSISSLASTSSASSGRRMIIPLYNLNVHAVMPTTILDAGTDAKVAKFSRRGLEVIGLAFFEPIEVRPSTPTNGFLVQSSTARRSLDDSTREFGVAPALSPPRRPVSVARPNTSCAVVNVSGDSPLKPTINLILPHPDSQPQRSTKRLFTKMFRKKDAAPPLPITVPLPEEFVSRQPSPSHYGTRRSDEIPVSQLDAPLAHDPLLPTPLTSTFTSQTAVLGVHSTLYPFVTNPKGRPIKYIWIVRKWLKGTGTSILNDMMGKLSIGTRDASAMSHSGPHIEVRFEWCRGQKKGSSRKSHADKSLNSRESHSPPPRRTPSSTIPRIASQNLSPDAQNQRTSVMLHSSGLESATSLSSSAHRHAEVSDEESDPEDSETPWTCTVTVQRLGQSPQPHQNGAPEPVIRLKVANLAPTPHHPTVVGLLKVPFPLPDIELECLGIRRRLLTTQGISRTAMSSASEFVLTAEEIKDTISSTALWLVVREAFGGVGRERKKGKS